MVAAALALNGAALFVNTFFLLGKKDGGSVGAG